MHTYNDEPEEETITLSRDDYQNLIQQCERTWESLVMEKAALQQAQKTIRDQAEGILRLQGRIREMHDELLKGRDE